MEAIKGLLSSKTFWFGVLVIVTAVAKLFGYAEYTPEQWVETVLLILGGLGAIWGRAVAKARIKGL